MLETDLKMPSDHVKAIAIERAHRTGGAQNAERDRTVVVNFTHFKDRDSVLQAARANQPRGVFVNEDFSMRVVSRRKELIPEMKEARDRGKIAYLSYDRLVVKDRSVINGEQTHRGIAKKTQPKPLFDSSKCCST